MTDHTERDNYLPEVVQRAAVALIAYDTSNAQTQLLAEKFLDAAYVAWLAYQEKPELLATHLQVSGVKLTGHSQRSPFSPVCRLLLSKAQLESGASLKFNPTKFVSKHARQLDAVHSEFTKERKRKNQPAPSSMTVNPGDIENFIQSHGGIQQIISMHDMVDVDNITQKDIDAWMGDLVRLQPINTDGSPIGDKDNCPHSIDDYFAMSKQASNPDIINDLELCTNTYCLAIIKSEETGDTGDVKRIKELREISHEVVCRLVAKHRASIENRISTTDNDDILLKLFKIELPDKF